MVTTVGTDQRGITTLIRTPKLRWIAAPLAAGALALPGTASAHDASIVCTPDGWKVTATNQDRNPVVTFGATTYTVRWSDGYSRTRSLPGTCTVTPPPPVDPPPVEPPSPPLPSMPPPAEVAPAPVSVVVVPDPIRPRVKLGPAIAQRTVVLRCRTYTRRPANATPGTRIPRLGQVRVRRDDTGKLAGYRDRWTIVTVNGKRRSATFHPGPFCGVRLPETTG